MDKVQDRTKKVSPSWFMRIVLLLLILACVQAFARENRHQIPCPYDLTFYKVLDYKVLELNNGLVLLLTWFTAMAARKQFLIGIRPHLTYTSRWDVDGSTVGLSSKNRVWAVQVQNASSGLAILNDTVYSLNGVSYTAYERTVEVLRDKGYEINIDYKLVRFSHGAAISLDKEQLVFAGTEDFIRNVKMELILKYEGTLEYSSSIKIRCYPSQVERPVTQRDAPSSHQAEGVGIMSEIDVAKEQIAYLKLWLGIMVVTNISLIGWFIGNYGQASTSLLFTSLLAIVVVSAGIVELHRRIGRQIERLKEL